MKYIYKIECLKTKRVYIGSTNNYKRRFQEHKRDLRQNKHYNKNLQKEYNLYGLSNFNFKILEIVSLSNSNVREDFWINSYGGVDSDRCYNCQDSKHQCLITKQRGAESRKGLLVGQKNPHYNKHTNGWNHPCLLKTKRLISQKQSTPPDKYTTHSENNIKYTDKFIQQLREQKSLGYTNTELGKQYRNI